jgi:hypothetical protein
MLDTLQGFVQQKFQSEKVEVKKVKTYNISEKKYEDKIEMGMVTLHSPLKYRYCIEGIFRLSIWSLIQAQICQKQEIEADELAILQAGATVQDGVELLEQFYYPNTDNWPLYAKIMNVINQRLFMPVINLPIIKQHMSHPPYKNRIEQLKKLQDNLSDKPLSKMCQNISR